MVLYIKGVCTSFRLEKVCWEKLHLHSIKLEILHAYRWIFQLCGVYPVIEMYVKYYCVVRMQFRSAKEKGAWNSSIDGWLYL